MTKVYNRKLKSIEEVKHFGKDSLTKIYGSRLLTRIATSKFVSFLYGLHNGTSFSKKKIESFIKENAVDMSLYEEKDYKSFNDFFIRKYKKIGFDKEGFISPCDGKLLVYKIDDDLRVKVKNTVYSVSELLESDDYNLTDSYMFVYRLSLDDCHRFYHIDDGKVLKSVRIKGRLHTVSDSSGEYAIYKENERSYSVLDTVHFGKVIYMEVGAMLVGRIINHDNKEFERGQEKGYFLPGASTVIIIASGIKVDDDIIQYSLRNIECKVNIGDRVGEKIC